MDEETYMLALGQANEARRIAEQHLAEADATIHHLEETQICQGEGQNMACPFARQRDEAIARHKARSK